MTVAFLRRVEIFLLTYLLYPPPECCGKEHCCLNAGCELDNGVLLEMEDMLCYLGAVLDADEECDLTKVRCPWKKCFVSTCLY